MPIGTLYLFYDKEGDRGRLKAYVDEYCFTTYIVSTSIFAAAGGIYSFIFFYLRYKAIAWP